MDSFYIHATNVGYYDKAIECLDDDQERIILQDKKKFMSMRMVRTMQLKHNRKEERILFNVHIYSEKGKDFEDAKVLKRYPFLQQF